MIKKSRYLTAKEAADALDISLSTLYAYVSRGLIRSEAGVGSKRDRLYYAEDVKQLQNRKEARRNPERVAEKALRAGAPVLESAITLIKDDCVYYRGQNTLHLATSESIERVAAFIWTGDLNADIPSLKSPDMKLSDRVQVVLEGVQTLKPVERFMAVLPVAGAEDLAAYDLRTEAVIQTGGRILRLLVQVATQGQMSNSIAQTLQQAWVPNLPEAVDLINMVLILYADHELNTSAFTARCAASAGATPYGAVCAGLAALQGYKHGAASERTELLFREAEMRGDVEQTVVDRLRLGEQISGFGHAVYRDVDPRAKVLLDCMAQRFPDSPHLALAHEIIDVTQRLTTVHYNIDLALTTLVRVLGLPDGSAMALFALGRVAGWIGHAIEQYELDQLIRPRARYVGLQPT
jgi:citrate synthase